MTTTQQFVALTVLALLSACSQKDREVTTGKSTALDKFEFKPKTAAEMAAPPSSAASARHSALDDFAFKPRSAAEMSKPRPAPPGRPPAALDKFVFVPRPAAETASGPR